MKKIIACALFSFLLNACASSSGTTSTVSVRQAVKVSTPDPDPDLDNYQQVLEQFGLFLDHRGRIIYQKPPACNGVKHFDVVYQVSPEHVIIGTDEADGVAIRLQQQEGAWRLYKTSVTYDHLLQLTWPLAPGIVRLALYSPVSKSQAVGLKRQLQQKWPEAKIEWSTNQKRQINSLKQWFSRDRIGYHGAIAELDSEDRDADFYSISEIELQYWVDSNYALQELELQVKNNQRFYHWFEQQPEQISQLGSTYGPVNRYPFCAQLEPLQRVRRLDSRQNPFALLPADTDFNKYAQLKLLIPNQLYITQDGNVRSLIENSQEADKEPQRPSILSQPVAPVKIKLDGNN